MTLSWSNDPTYMDQNAYEEVLSDVLQLRRLHVLNMMAESIPESEDVKDACYGGAGLLTHVSDMCLGL